MNRVNKKITLIFRFKDKGRYSIEKLYSGFLDCDNISYFQIPCNLNSIKSSFKIFLFLIFKKIDSKILHITGDVNYVTIFFPFKYKILTIHDFYNLKKFKGFKRSIYKLFWFDIPIWQSKSIIVISNSTYQDFMHYYPKQASKVCRINNAVKFKQIELEIKRDKEKFNILAIGSTENKNIQNLIEAVKDLDDIKIIIVGVNKYEYLLNKYNIEYEIHFDINNFELLKLYHESSLLYFASTSEGFGIPILEANFYSLPVITSNISPMTDVAGDGAFFVNPFDVDDIRTGILEVKSNTEIQESLIKNGLANVKKYDYSTFMNKHFEIYNKIK
jgi:glycosyltransferase involved in cell wall biosynthesis